MADLSPIAVARFWSKVDVGHDHDCWTWRGNITSRYGRFQEMRAHRVAFTLCKGQIPHGLLIRHLCGNRLCMNPAHLEPGTHKDNAQDAIRLGELAIDDRHPRSKLSPESVELILENPEGLTGRALAEQLGVSESLVSYIRSGKRRWRHYAQNSKNKRPTTHRQTRRSG